MTIDIEKLADRPPLPEGPMSFEEFVERCPENAHAEWVDGQAILLHVTVAERHDFIVKFLTWLFNHVSRFGRLGVVHGEPFLMHLPGLRRGRAPDLFFVRDERRHLLRRHFLEGPADIVVEVLSPEGVHRDRVEKLAEYEQAGVPEYWLIDVEALAAEFRVLGPDGRYRLVLAGSGGQYESVVLPGLRLRVEWLWQERGPEMDEVLRLLGGQ
ncbi:MAG TPA: Uma2 family endonuclease [Chloroflexota bacterium]|nr:Uma2 family endonuclease [Chloroflexota bacterium]